MTVFLSIIVSLCVLASTVCSVVLPQKWERLTCKVTTEGMIGTGFLLRYADRVFIVTNRHVATPGESAFYLNLKSETGVRPGSKLDSTLVEQAKSSVERVIPHESMYFFDPNYDLAFIHITEHAHKLDATMIPESMVGDDSMIVAGREVFFLGYPNGMAGYNSTVPLVRGGIIAGDFRHKIILDGNIFGGSSGSPVFLNVDLENGVMGQHLVGIVSEMRGTPTITDSSVVENMGIGIAIKISYLIGTIENWLNGQK